MPIVTHGPVSAVMEDELINFLRDVTRKQTQERRAQSEASNALRLSQHAPLPYGGSRAGLHPSYQTFPASSLPRRFEERCSTLGSLWPVILDTSISESLVRSNNREVASRRKS